MKFILTFLLLVGATLEAKTVEEIEAIKKQEIALAMEQNKALNFLQMREIETGTDIFEPKEIPQLPIPKPTEKPKTKAKKPQRKNRRKNGRKIRKNQQKNRRKYQRKNQRKNLQRNRGNRRILKSCWHRAFRKFWRWLKRNKKLRNKIN